MNHRYNNQADVSLSHPEAPTQNKAPPSQLCQVFLHYKNSVTLVGANP